MLSLRPAMKSGKLNWLYGYQAVVYAAGLLLATGLVAEWGAWYSTSLPYRAQTEALLRGDLAVSRTVADLKFDHTWSEQGVHQVWGLGVPLWRLPFEAAAKLFGFDGFPDRIAFGLFALLVGFVVLKVWVAFDDRGSELGDQADSGNVLPVGPPAGGGGSSGLGSSKGADGWQLITGFGAGFLILLLFPPFLTLLQVRGAVWEEAVAYEYLYGILQVSLLVAFVRRPTIGRLLLVCALAGFGGLIRPTLVFYGFATVVIATVAWVFNVGQAFKSLSLSIGRSRCEEAQTSTVSEASRESLLSPALSSIRNGGEGGPAIAGSGEAVLPLQRIADRLETSPALGRVLAPALLGLFLFGFGGGVLWLTNLKRFGDGFEFGHKLNVQQLYGSMHATRFDDPFQDEPLTGAAKELFGALFLASKFNGGDWYQENIFPGQSATVRWREFYFRTYDLSYLPLLLLGWGAAVAAGFKFRVSSFKLGSSALPCGPPAVGPTTRQPDDLSGTVAAGTKDSVGVLLSGDRPPARSISGAPSTGSASAGGCGFSETASPGTNASDASQPGALTLTGAPVSDPASAGGCGFSETASPGTNAPDSSLPRASTVTGAPVSGPASAGGCGFSETASPGTSASGSLPLLTLGLWSLLAVIPLAGFYLYAPVISSRYLMDLAPAFAAAITGAWLWITARCERRWSRVLVCLLLCAWLGVQLYLSRSVYGGPASVTAAELKVLRDQRPATDGSTTNTYTADDYGQSLNGNRSSIPFDRVGWNAETGAVMPLVILFVKDAEFLELDFATQPHPRIPPDPEAIRAKVGLEFLEREQITKTEQGWRVRFRGPQQPRWRDGLQGAFVATVPKEFLAERTTPWLLKSARWRAPAATEEDATDHR